MTLILGIETSCDESSVAIVDDQKNIHAHLIRSQMKEHAPYGGVVPEIASRAHMDVLDTLILQAMQEAGLNKDFSKLDAIAVTAGPGLIGGVIVGVMMAKGLSAVTGVPLIGVNHLEGHALSVRLNHDVAFPYLLLLVSGGHCQLMIVNNVGEYELLGTTIDDALGEAYDKVAKMLGLGYPGGPIVEKLAKGGNESRFDLPRPIIHKKNCDFSFAGLKTAVKRIVDGQAKWNDQDTSDLCASFQRAVADILQNRMQRALEHYRIAYPNAKHVVIAGGVAANQYLRNVLSELVTSHHCILSAPEMKLCTDNGAMIAWVGVERLKLGMVGGKVIPRARWDIRE